MNTIFIFSRNQMILGVNGYFQAEFGEKRAVWTVWLLFVAYSVGTSPLSIRSRLSLRIEPAQKIFFQKLHFFMQLRGFFNPFV